MKNIHIIEGHDNDYAAFVDDGLSKFNADKGHPDGRTFYTIAYSIIKKDVLAGQH